MWQCGIQSRKIVCGQARRTEPSTLQFHAVQSITERRNGGVGLKRTSG